MKGSNRLSRIRRSSWLVGCLATIPQLEERANLRMILESTCRRRQSHLPVCTDVPPRAVVTALAGHVRWSPHICQSRCTIMCGMQVLDSTKAWHQAVLVLAQSFFRMACTTCSVTAVPYAIRQRPKGRGCHRGKGRKISQSTRDANR